MTGWRIEGMSSQYAVALVLGLLPLQVLIYLLIDRWFHDGTEVIATGVSRRGVRLAVWHRRLLLSFQWVGVVGLQIAFTSVAAIAWWVFGSNASVEEIKLLAYLMVFAWGGTAVGWILVMPVWYVRLASVVRQAEAD